MKLHNISALIICGAVLGSCSDNAYDPGEPNPGRPAEDYAIGKSVNINPSVAYQTIAGFSASDAWQCAWVGRDWTNSRQGIADLLFSQEIKNGQPKGIGLSMWRVNLGGGSAEIGDASGISTVHRRAESFMGADGKTLDWSKCTGQRFFMEQARKAGVEKFVFFSNSPLVQWTYNGQGRSDRVDHSNLMPSKYPAFANYMADVTRHFVDEGYNITHISPINEPMVYWDGHDQEGTAWTVAESAKLARELDRALTERNLDTQILLAENDRWDYLNGDREWAGQTDIASHYWTEGDESYIGDLRHAPRLFGAHSYWTDTDWNGMREVRAKAAAKARQFGLELWQTEWCMLGDGHNTDEYPGHGSATDMERALYMTRVIHNDLTVANVSSWSYWVAIDGRDQHNNRWLLIFLDMATGTSGSVFDGEGSYAPSLNLWALGNFSRFIRPGFKRIDLATTESRNFFGSAYISPDGKRLVAVYSNCSQKPVKIDTSIEGGFNASQIHSYTTSTSKSLLEASITDAKSILLDPQSITTIVYDL